MSLRGRVGGPAFVVAGMLVGCAPPPPPADDEPARASNARAATIEGNELDIALAAPAIDHAPFVGTYDVSGDPNLGRFILLHDGIAAVCSPVIGEDGLGECAPLGGTPLHPYEVRQPKGSGGMHFLVFRTSRDDDTPFRIYAVDGAKIREVVRIGSPSPGTLRRLPCSETMYREESAVLACAYYRCKVDSDGCSYFREFGLPYCEKFYDVAFDDAAFGRRVRHCLQEAIRDSMEGLACTLVDDAAVDSHVDCYLASGYCSLSTTDKFRLVKTLELEDWSLTNAYAMARIEAACVD